MLLRRARLRVGLAPDVRAFAPRTGHGVVWSNLLAALERIPGVKLVAGRRADVWLASGHDQLPDGRPLVVQVHEASWRAPELRAFLHEEFAAAMEQATARAIGVADHVIVPSQASRTQVLDAYELAPERVHAVAHGVDRMIFRPGIDRGPTAPGAPYVLFVGVLHPRKNLLAVRAAVLELARSGLPHCLAVVGNPPADPEWITAAQQMIAELPGFPGRVQVFDAVPSAQLAALMAGADVFCLPSHFEGFGIPVLEAMACGAPVVVSDRGALPEVVGDAGLVVAPEPEPVLEAIRALIEDRSLARRLGAAAASRAAHFSWERTASGWLDVLRLAA